MVSGTALRKSRGPRPLGLPRGCSTGKRSYVTKANALIAAVLLSKKFGEPRFAYFHPECKQYHLTHIESESVVRV